MSVEASDRSSRLMRVAGLRDALTSALAELSWGQMPTDPSALAELADHARTIVIYVRPGMPFGPWTSRVAHEIEAIVELDDRTIITTGGIDYPVTPQMWATIEAVLWDQRKTERCVRCGRSNLRFRPGLMLCDDCFNPWRDGRYAKIDKRLAAIERRFANRHKRGRHKRHGLSKRRRFAILERDHFTCTYCGQRPPDVQLVVDHVVPVSKGGDDVDENLVTACTDCNAGKAARELVHG